MKRSGWVKLTELVSRLLPQAIVRRRGAGRFDEVARIGGRKWVHVAYAARTVAVASCRRTTAGAAVRMGAS